MIYLGADHGGFKLKEKVKQWLDEWKLPYLDLGAHQLNAEDDYPQFAFAVAEKISQEDEMRLPWEKRPKGILICCSAAGMVIAANKIRAVRAVVAVDVQSAKHSREHNDANVLGLSGDWLTDEATKAILKTWLATEFSQKERHRRRIEQIQMKESNEGCCGGGCGSC